MTTTGALPGHVVAGIVIGCAAPMAALNIWPRIEAMLEQGVSGNQIGIVILVTMSALGMAAIPFSMQKSQNWGFWFLCLCFGLVLCALNYAMAVGAIGKVQDYESSGNEKLRLQSETLEGQIINLRGKISALGTFPFTTEEMVSTAQQAVTLAVQARDQECGKVGDNCRARVAQLAARQADLATIAAQRALTKRSEALAAELGEKESQKAILGPIPSSVSPQAARISAVLIAVGIDLGKKPVETTANLLIQLLAIVAEVFGLIMPRIFVTALSRNEHQQAIKPPRALPLPAPKTIELKATEIFPPQALPTPKRKISPSEDVKTWALKYLTKAPGKHLAARSAYAAYIARYPGGVSFEVFDSQITSKKEKQKGELIYLHTKLI